MNRPFLKQDLMLTLFFLFFATLLSNSSSWASDTSITFFGEGGKKLCSFEAELAVTPEQQEKGLMFRKSLRKDAGMLFVFDSDQLRFFWMKNTYIPLDLVFITSKLVVASISRHAKPFDETTLPSTVPARYVLEINAGEAARCKIKVGSKVQIRKNISR
jgi:uncharacterized protein